MNARYCSHTVIVRRAGKSGGGGPAACKESVQTSRARSPHPGLRSLQALQRPCPRNARARRRCGARRANVRGRSRSAVAARPCPHVRGAHRRSSRAGWTVHNRRNRSPRPRSRLRSVRPPTIDRRTDKTPTGPKETSRHGHTAHHTAPPAALARTSALRRHPAEESKTQRS